MIIGILGAKNSGKNTVANYLISNYNFTKIAYADPVKDICSILFGWNRELLEGDTDESRNWREIIDVYWEEKLKIKGFTPRLALTLVGTDIFREHLNQNIWVDSLIKKIKDKNYVVTDCRHIRETKEILNKGGIIIRVRRDEMPNWESLAKKAVFGDKSAKNKMKKMGFHISEYEWVCCEYTYDIINNESIEKLYTQIQNIMNII